ncbi:hydroxylamine reductase [Bacteroides fragilis]|uniref:Hydroxylamine reductase n=2 Tax=Bacteroides fragilis TaxID=817 RepID=HCP_BACFN|nr:hydroxylamine reductase [Bacteroides fragilis]Q5LDB2.1 RecName: Full=Hydroxylamine reductase; AltName: Full=Hybrid-cluster protein; Short=HCP; AltName: Full=Prismane protein [Bacteroides fragilis NCTC 9343]EXZ94578.1 hydroxylamine reductase [Bacteroides fragilis str. Korea 419]ANQ60556.1 hydroxylamine reductase [Bacteroides fragilis]KXU49309.1 hydroxylamine reductase [Bacteroides fragilis]KXU49509.1 hydroxylamine reductase [Bacteroides fragilis]MBK1430281.1 hydroxylamine reductase [Bactero
MSMFCFQCQETAKGTGCILSGVCGKTPEVANMQDLLLFVVRGIAVYNQALRKDGRSSARADKFIFDALFTTITNANFDKHAIIKKIKKGLELKKDLSNQVTIEHAPDECTWYGDETEFEEKAQTVGVLRTSDEDIRSLKELVHYGIKGMAAYVEHAYNLGYENPEIFAFMQYALAELTREDITVDELITLTLATGNHGVQAMAQLDTANTSHYGNPEISEVNIGVRNNPGILVSGHDLKDIEELLQQTEGTGIDIYTHSEMLPAHYYPQLKKYKHLVGNYGNAWWKQKEEFESFNGPILFTTNCIVPPRPNATYKDRIYTTGATGLEGATYIPERKDGKQKDFSVIIEHARRCQPPVAIESGKIVGGFAHAQVIALADKVVEAVKSGAIRKFFVMAGCDGRMKSRSYYTEFAEKLPADTVILTAGCAKYRYNKLPLGDINGIPRVLDAGQCNDSYSLAIIAMKLQEVFGLKDINDLPIVYNIAWYEQKAVIVLLALLALGVKKIHLGPTLPAFLSPNVKQVLIDNFGIGGISTADEDIAKFLA